jgi:nucleotide-binding universal stress UspA family protein
VKILAATDFSARSQRALRRAGLVARDRGAVLTLVHVVDDDLPAGLIELERREAEKYLQEQIGSLSELGGVECRAVVVTGDAFDGILRTAASCAADLIVMGVHRKQLLRDIFVGTTIERVIRTGPYPVLMVNKEVAGPYEKAIAAVDMSDPSAHAIAVADSLRLIDSAGVTLVHGFQAFARGKMSIAGIGHEQVADYVAGERSRAMMELLAFLESNGLGAHGASLRVEEGGPLEVIGKAVQELSPDLLMIGTHGRSGIVKVLLGSVTEEVLRSVDIDVLAVPPIR